MTVLNGCVNTEPCGREPYCDKQEPLLGYTVPSVQRLTPIASSVRCFPWVDSMITVSYGGQTELPPSGGPTRS